MKKSLFLLSLILTCFFSNAQNLIIGKVIDQAGTPIQFGSVFIEKTNLSTSINTDGLFKLSVPSGKHQLSIKALGYKAKSVSIAHNQKEQIVIELETESYSIEDVIIRAGKEDPAFGIMRKVISKRKSHLNEVKEFSTEVYIKGLQRAISIPKKILGNDISDMTKDMGLDSNGKGILYLSESQSIYSFKAPNTVHEELISSKVSGSNRAFSFNRVSDLNTNLYENTLSLEDLSLRPLISPIADNALFYYNYKYLGVSEENGKSIFKIKVIPKRSADPVFRGTLYIVDQAWRLYDVDLILSKEVNLNFIDSLKIRQQFTPIKNDVWMVSNQQLEFAGGLFGFKFAGAYTAVFSKYNIDPSTPRKKSAELMKVSADANKKDTLFWNLNRPVPLTLEEKNDYEVKAILSAKRESKPYLDSIDQKRNKFTISKILFSGYDHSNRYDKEYWSFNSIKEALFFNTVEGVGLNYSASFTKQIDTLTQKFLRVTGKLRYGFASEKFYPSASATIPIKNFRINLAAGMDALDLNNQANQSQLGNTLNSLIFETNRLKLYEKKFAFASINGRISGGLTGMFFTEFASRDALTNNSSYKWKDWKDRTYTSNNPFTPTQDFPLFTKNQSFKIGGAISYNFSNKYESHPTGKYYVASKYPTITAGFVKGMPNILGSDVNYELVYANVSKSNIGLGMYGKFKFVVGAGKFLSNKAIYFPDFAHFNGSESTAFESSSNAFLFLDPYRSSTPKAYFQAHAEQNFSGFILNKIPLLRKAKLQEIVGLNYLSTPGTANHLEAYFGFTHLIGLKVLYGYSFEDGKRAQHGFRIGFNF